MRREDDSTDQVTSMVQRTDVRRALKASLRSALFAIAPRSATTLVSARARAHSHQLVKAWGLHDINQRMLAILGNTVRSGPFRGLRLTPMTWEEHIGPYLLGTYESELHGWWAELLERRFDLIVDVGSSFGYYAVGLAVKYPRARVVAFDTDWWARRAVRQMARSNGAANVSVRGFCTPQWLGGEIGSDALIVSDCEGYEGTLCCGIDPSAAARTTLLIELHESFSPGVSARVEAHFARSHDVRRVASRTDTTVPPGIAVPSLTAEELQRAASEVRPPQEWLLLTPRA